MRIALIAPLVTPIAQPFTGGAQAILADILRKDYACAAIM